MLVVTGRSVILGIRELTGLDFLGNRKKVRSSDVSIISRGFENNLKTCPHRNFPRE